MKNKILSSEHKTGILLVSIYLFLALSTVYSTGVMWDETRYIAQAKARAYSIYAYSTGGYGLPFCDISQDFRGTEWGERCWEGRPKAAITLSGLTWASIWFLNGKELSVLSSIAAHRVAIILLTAVGLFFLYRFASEMFNKDVALFSTLSLIFMPRFFVHSKFVLMDESSAIMGLLAIYIFWKGLKNWKYALAFGLVFGYSLTFKIQNTFVILIIPLWFLVSYRDIIPRNVKNGGVKAGLKMFLGLNLNEQERNHKITGKFGEDKIVIFRTMAFSTLVLAPITFLLSYPWIWKDTLSRVSYLIGYYISHSEMHATSALASANGFFGPHSLLYPFILTFITLPPVIGLFLIIGTLTSLRNTVTFKNRDTFLVFCGAFVPHFILAVTHSTRNGVEHLLPAYPFIAILAGIGAYEFLTSLNKLLKTGGSKLIFFGIIIFLVAPGLYIISQGHEDTYFNAFIGGREGAYKHNIELEWSGEAYLETVYWLNSNAIENSTIYVSKAPNIFRTYKYGDIGQITRRMNVSNIGFTSSLFEQETLLRQDIEIVGDWESQYPNTLKDADYLIILKRLTYFPDVDYFVKGHGCKPLYSVSVDNVALVDIYEVECFKENNYVFVDLSIK